MVGEKMKKTSFLKQKEQAGDFVNVVFERSVGYFFLSFYGIDRNIQFFGNLIIVFALYGKNENSFTFGRKIFLGFKQYPLHFFLYNEIFE